MNRRGVLIASVSAAGLVTALAAFPEGPKPLRIDARTMADLKALRAEPKFLDLPGAPAVEERRRLESLINQLIDRLIAGVQANPTDAWVLAQMNPTVKAFHLEDTEARERCLNYIETIFRILGIPNDRGAFRKYMIFW